MISAEMYIKTSFGSDHSFVLENFDSITKSAITKAKEYAELRNEYRGK